MAKLMTPFWFDEVDGSYERDPFVVQSDALRYAEEHAEERVQEATAPLLERIAELERLVDGVAAGLDAPNAPAWVQEGVRVLRAALTPRDGGGE